MTTQERHQKEVAMAKLIEELNQDAEHEAEMADLYARLTGHH